jgi:TonB family protein
MYSHLPRAFVVLALLTLSTLAGAAAAQAPAPPPAAPPDPPARTATKKVTPTYPEVARNARLEGTVRLSVVVTEQGRVKSVAVMGGHPVFAVAATDAAKQWRFTPAAKESTLPLVFDFKSPDR